MKPESDFLHRLALYWMWIRFKKWVGSGRVVIPATRNTGITGRGLLLNRAERLFGRRLEYCLRVYESYSQNAWNIIDKDQAVVVR